MNREREMPGIDRFIGNIGISSCHREASVRLQHKTLTTRYEAVKPLAFARHSSFCFVELEAQASNSWLCQTKQKGNVLDTTRRVYPGPFQLCRGLAVPFKEALALLTSPFLVWLVWRHMPPNLYIQTQPNKRNETGTANT